MGNPSLYKVATTYDVQDALQDPRESMTEQTRSYIFDCGTRDTTLSEQSRGAQNG